MPSGRKTESIPAAQPGNRRWSAAALAAAGGPGTIPVDEHRASDALGGCLLSGLEGPATQLAAGVQEAREPVEDVRGGGEAHGTRDADVGGAGMSDMPGGVVDEAEPRHRATPPQLVGAEDQLVDGRGDGQGAQLQIRRGGLRRSTHDRRSLISPSSHAVPRVSSRRSVGVIAGAGRSITGIGTDHPFRGYPITGDGRLQV
jgi:hypothetical protein